MNTAILAFLFDCIIGDPNTKWHPVALIGRLISALEHFLYRPQDSDARKFASGAILVLLVLLISYEAAAAIVMASYHIPFPWATEVISALLVSFTISPKSLAKAGKAIYARLVLDDLAGARERVGWIVGRETQNLDAGEVTRATIETIAENTNDGIIAPLFFFAIGGAPLAVFYRAANTMDSMIGYKNDQYKYFGTAAARLDDICNFIPARISALFMCIAAMFLGLDWKGAFRIWRRDARKSTSPNSGQTEAAMAGALGVELLGDAYYFGKLVHKPAIGDSKREITPEDIETANRIMYLSVFMIYFVGIMIMRTVMLYSGWI